MDTVIKTITPNQADIVDLTWTAHWNMGMITTHLKKQLNEMVIISQVTLPYF